MILSILQPLIDADTAATLWINGWHTSFWDQFFYAFSYRWTWLFFYLMLVVILLRREGKKVYLPLLLIGVTILLNDQISSFVVKPLVGRIRPSLDPELSPLIHIVNGYRSSMHSFVSSHASNTAALTTLFALLYRDRLLSGTLLLWTLLTAYSRVYLGVHFLGDTLGGILLGALCAIIVWGLFRNIIRPHRQPAAYERALFLGSFLATVIGCVLFSLLH